MLRCSLLFLALFPWPAFADPPIIEAVQITGGASGVRVDVTLSHPDTGWEHYADGWRIEDAQGNVLGTRELAHPHVTEQPFTRSLSGVVIPSNIKNVFIRAKCQIDGWNKTTTSVALP